MEFKDPKNINPKLRQSDGNKEHTDRLVSRIRQIMQLQRNPRGDGIRTTDEISKLHQRVEELDNALKEALRSGAEKDTRIAFLEKKVNYDSMTGLHSRLYFEDRLLEEVSRAIRENKDILLIFADLNGLKAANDSMGHEAGDKLITDAARAIKKAADNIRTSLREYDVVSARMGGDEFIIMMPGAGTSYKDAIVRRINSLCEKAGISVALGAANLSEVVQGGSIPSNTLVGKASKELKSLADERMYEDKVIKKGSK